MKMKNLFESENEIKSVVRGFESGTTGKDDFPHRDHLAMAVWYLRGSDTIEATGRMRASLHRFLDHYNSRKNYHETMTVFWIKLVSEVLASLDDDGSLLRATNAVTERLNDSRIVYDYYSRELVGSDEAKQKWIEPDLKTFKA
ncbi:MAG: hypothetical protein ABJB97_06405 [Acidobacteriota bacterium]